jgi:branched-chain amino acid transport system ATP-binding protein
VLEVTDLGVRYGSVLAVEGVSLSVAEREIVAVIGPNGAGKSSLLRAISGLERPAAGRIVFEGTDIAGWRPHRIVSRGLSHAPEGRRLFPHMTVLDNLKMGAYLGRNGGAVQRGLGEVVARFPRLAERRHQLAGTLSGGEQQMLAIGRALMSGPRLLMLDEPSLGLAPLLVHEIGRIVGDINQDRKVAVLLVEQNARMALAISARTYVMEIGRVVLSGPSATLRESPHVKAAYLGGR